MTRPSVHAISACAAALALVAAALPVAAADAARPAFAASAALTFDAAADGLQRVALPLAVLQRLKTADRRDIRVFNAAGEAVPMAWAGTPTETAREPMPAGELPRFVWPEAAAERASRQAGGGGPGIDADVKVDVNAGGAVVRVRRSGIRAAAPNGARDWLLDLSKFPSFESGARPAALEIDWKAPAAGLVRRVLVLASADARRWVAAGEGTVLDLPDATGAAGATPVRQRRVELGRLAADIRYLRVQFDEPLELARVQAFAAASVARPAHDHERFKPLRRAPREWTLDSGATLPVAALQVHLMQDNAVWPLSVAWSAAIAAGAAAPAADDWRALSGHTAFRLQRGAVRAESPAQDFGPVAARHWRLRLDDRIAAPELGPEITLSWVAPQLVFAARGPAPFHLGFGAEGAAAAALEPAALIPGYRAGDEFKLPQARAGAVTERPMVAPGLGERLKSAWSVDPRRWLLWATLAVAVVVLGLLAWRLARDLGSKPAEPRTPERGR